MKLEELTAGAGITTAPGNREKNVTGITSDSRKAGKGELFVCLDGIRERGIDHIPEAVSKGITAVLVKKGERPPLPEGIALLEAEEPRKALATLCSKINHDPQRKMRMIAVTGTNGKTSVTKILCAILNKAGIRAETVGTLDGRMTTPDPEELYPILAEKAERGIGAVCMEASSHALYLDKLEPIDFEIGIITNVTGDHLDFHKDMESYARAKEKLFSKTRTGLFNADDMICRRMANRAGGRTLFFSAGENGDADYVARNTALLGENGCVFDFFTHTDLFRVRGKMPGITGVYNTLSAVAAAYEMGIPKSVIKEATEEFPGVRGRLERVPLEGADFSAFIDFAHTPDALEKLLLTVRGFSEKDQRIVLLFGCGGDRDRTKRPEMGRIASALADKIIVTSDNPRSERPDMIISEILKGIGGEKEIAVLDDRREAIRYAVRTARKRDIILLAGKGHETEETVMGERRHFDEREILREAYAERGSL